MTFLKNVLAPIVGVGIIAGVLASEVLPLIGTLFFVVGGGYFLSLLFNELKDTQEDLNTLNDEYTTTRQSLLESKQASSRYEAMIGRMQEDMLKDKETINNLQTKVDEYIKLNDLIFETSKEQEVEPEVKPKAKTTRTTKTVKKSTK